MEIIATMVNNGFDSKMDVWLVQVITRPRLETLPFTGVVFVFGMYPYFWTIEPI
jgi:hypothetical protein